MKYIKTYEDNNDQLELYEYVICKDDINYNDNNDTHAKYINFLETNIGKYISKGVSDYYCYNILYKNVPENIRDYFDGKINHKVYPEDYQIFRASKNDIIYHSSNNKDLEIIIHQDKYNL